MHTKWCLVGNYSYIYTIYACIQNMRKNEINIAKSIASLLQSEFKMTIKKIQMFFFQYIYII